MEEKSERLFIEIAILSKNIFISAFVLGFITLLLSITEIDWLAQAWLRGISPFYSPATPWSQLSGGRKFLLCFYSALLFTAVVGMILTIMGTFQNSLNDGARMNLRSFQDLGGFFIGDNFCG